MRLLILFSLLFAAHAFSTDILYWPVGWSQPSLLARVSYDPTSLKSDVSYHTPRGLNGDLVRVGLYTSTPTNKKQWVGSLVSASSLIGNPTFRLHLDAAHEVYHVSLSTPSTSESTSGPQLDIVSYEPGPQPHLNRPIVLGPEGEEPQVEEKSLFQR